MKNKKAVKGLAIIISIIVIAQIFSMPKVEAKERSFVDASTSIGGNIQNQLIYFTAPINLWYYFYHEGNNIVWRTSKYGETWSAEWIHNVGFTIAGGGFDVCKGTNGDVHFIMIKLDVAGDEYYYLNGNPHLDASGNMSFGSTHLTITIPATDVGGNPRIETDSDNYAWIGFSQFDGVNAYPKLLVNGMNDGTWSTNFTGNVELNAGTAWSVIPCRLNDRKMMIVHAESGSRKMRFRLWLGNGSGWNNTAKNLSKYNIRTYAHFDADSLGDKVYVSYVNETHFNLRYIEWSGQLTPNAGWSDTLTGTIVDTNSYPNVAKIRGKDLVIVTWMQKRSAGGGRCIYYQTRNKGIWLASPAVWWNETGNTVSINAKGINKRIREKANKDWVGLAYVRTSGTPTGAWFASLGALELGFPEDAPYLVPNTTRLDTDDGYIFEKEVYRLITTFNNTNYAKINFTDGVHQISLEYRNETDEMSVKADEEFVIGGIWTNFTRNGSLVTLKWRFQINKNIRDEQNVYLYWYAEHINGSSVFNVGTVDIPPFNIYNLGGYTTYTFVGDGQRVGEAQSFDLQATDGSLGSSAYAEQVYRRLQHTHFLVEFDFANDWNNTSNSLDIYGGNGFFEFGFDYMVNGSWVTGWKIRTYIQNGDVGHHGAIPPNNLDASWMEMVCDWYNRGFNNKTTYLQTYHWGYDTEHSPNDHTQRLSTQMWIDLWFPIDEESTKVGGHINSYWHGMFEQANPYWWGYGAFRPKIGNYTESLFEDYLYNGSSAGGFKKKEESVISTMDLEIVRVWVKVAKLNYANSNDDPYTIKIHEYKRQTADDKFEGINRPDFIETLDPSMPSVGWTNPITSILGMLGGIISKGLIQAWKTLWGAMDTFMSWAMPFNLWDRMVNFITYLIKLVQLGLANIPMLIGNMVTVLTDQFSFIIVFVPRYIIFLGIFASSIVNWWNLFVQIMTGQYTGFSNIWNMLAIEQWIILGINLFPIWEFFFRILPAKDSVKQAKEDAELVISLFSRVFDFGYKLVNILLSVFSFIRNLLPF